ncbi:BolA family protein [Uliginosibacterium sp. H3]|uniref:BolA family protein n=1 Tax=Uliginosibacterium silvisoli TaxID=3114758 RepID=A0ABU6K846_9RHOO|nr:BolA family protein [Uliginosibacterium sp. H3]
MSASTTLERMREGLDALSPTLVELDDDSLRHAGHAGAASGGGHYNLRIISTRFTGLTRIARHRLVYSTLAPLMQREIHALSIIALTPDEASAQQEPV